MAKLRESKKQATRERLSTIATDLFFARGFDAVTVEEIAAAAEVSKATVFNYFTCKEDLFLDREAEVKELLHGAVGGQPKDPIAALRALVTTLVEDEHPFARIDARTAGWWRVVAASPSLVSRVRSFGDELVPWLARELTPHGKEPDGALLLVAGIIILSWRTAFAEALRVFERGGSQKKTSATFIALVDRGFAAARSI